MKRELKKKRKDLILGIMLLVIALLSSSYAFFTYTREIEAFTITSSSIKVTFEAGTNSVDFKNAYPISDAFALNNLNNLTYIDFTVSSEIDDLNQDVEYELFLTEEDGNTLDSSFVKVYLTDGNNRTIVSPKTYSSLENTTYKNSANGKVIYKNNNSGIFTKNYRLYVWLDSSYSQNEISQTFSFKVNIYAYNN